MLTEEEREALLARGGAGVTREGVRIASPLRVVVLGAAATVTYVAVLALIAVVFDLKAAKGLAMAFACGTIITASLAYVVNFIPRLPSELDPAQQARVVAVLAGREPLPADDPYLAAIVAGVAQRCYVEAARQCPPDRVDGFRRFALLMSGAFGFLLITFALEGDVVFALGLAPALVFTAWCRTVARPDRLGPAFDRLASLAGVDTATATGTAHAPSPAPEPESAAKPWDDWDPRTRTYRGERIG